MGFHRHQILRHGMYVYRVVVAISNTEYTLDTYHKKGEYALVFRDSMAQKQLWQEKIYRLLLGLLPA